MWSRPTDPVRNVRMCVSRRFWTGAEVGQLDGTSRHEGEYPVAGERVVEEPGIHQ